MEPVYLSWSGGKDSCLALYRLLRWKEWSDRYRVVKLLATVTEVYDRSSIHGIRRELLRRQAESIGIDLLELPLPVPCSNEDYDRIMAGAMEEAKACGVRTVAFGDLFLEDIRAYREERLARAGMQALFPLWGEATSRVASELIALGFKARVVAVNPGAGLDRSFAGRLYNASFLSELPPGIDPCGERGEFHTFVFDGPLFARPVEHTVGTVEEREHAVFIDLLPA